MKKICTSITMLLLAFAMNAQQAATVFGELLVQLNKGVTTQSAEAAVYEALGMEPNFKMVRNIAPTMDIWLCTFDETAISKPEMLRQLHSIAGIRVAQVNHVIEDRIVPNDPFFSQQWHHVQTDDHDIDTDLAWDITTGGQTATGDDIVVCVVETGGATWSQADIADNHWVNAGEIANNGIDDDGNGYVDDYDGWNITSDSDNIDGGNHGTQVSSMIGAKGNNSTGVTGVNWDVKIMQVQMGGISESNVIEAYQYPLRMRKLYNQSGGQQGAFVVATNSSWGTDNGQPADAPLWCAMYDSLGYYGILSCGATTNSNANVDAVGDLPTACPSDFMVSVGRTNSNDVRNSGGYGLTTIDLMAPGDNVYLANNNGYATTTGTSFSSPCTAGSIALLYSAPCTSLMSIAYASPSEAALMIRDYILDGVDQTTQLLGETVSGGRLNVNNSLALLMSECTNGSCLAPFGVSVAQTAGTTTYTISWAAIDEGGLFGLRYREVGAAEWIEVLDISGTSYSLENLTYCTEYEFQLNTNCGKGSSDWSSSFTIQSDGCCENPLSYTVSQQTESTATVSWPSVLAATSYEVQLWLNEEVVNTFSNITGTSYSFTGLAPCTFYDVVVISQCGDNTAATYTGSFNTTGCGSCAELPYCSVTSNSGSEFISNVTVGDINHTSADDGGYILVAGQTTTFYASGVYPVSCTPGFDGFAYNEYFKIWIDYNMNGQYEEPSELAFDAGSAMSTTVTGNIIIPANIPNGSTRMRVGMSYVGSFGGGAPPVTCGSNAYGETEDYCVTLDSDVSVGDELKDQLSVYPNPASDVVLLKWNGYHTVSLFDAKGMLIRSLSFNQNISLDLSDLAKGVYFLKSDDSASVTRLMKL